MGYANNTGEKRRWVERLLGRPTAEIQALSSEQIPRRYRDGIREYFDQLGKDE